MAAYEEVSPGSALKIIEMAQAEQQIRHHCMKTDVDAIPRGQKFAMCSFVAAMITTCIIAYLGSPGAAAGFGGGAITVFGGAFILARHYGAKEEKAEQPKPSTPKKPKTRSRKG
ncbi:hypothetical protein B0E48_07780 [Rhodanobacter sp. C03]|nr:hypothetical protein B0E48_07780 [Rhodanobacter sp. C03]